ncbi:branched-chain amino acid ABC transporter permease [Leisingera daeponensis]|uniref:branched-chain amino acid ABC transporter permease n=1 Tax=Leisingera daeponensis TaxID=405746 RepID=UPI001C94417E|nr:branched-chain amino acid ABC transporter permease [Leisingera daeponensis]MBY6058777.1 branched-chain amino acid ABC transporter permease [Leisingera daeponensis]
MDSAQLIMNGLALGALYACLAVGFSLVWGVLNVINMVHGSFIVLGGYLAYFMWSYFGVYPLAALPLVGIVMFVFGYVLQYTLTNKVIHAPVLTTLTLTFGLDMILYNLMTVYFSATPRRIRLDLGSFEVFGTFMPADRLLGMLLALTLTGMLYYVMRSSKIGRAIVAVRMDRVAAQLMGIRVNNIYAITFGIGAMMAGLAGVILVIVFPTTTSVAGAYLGKAFVVCVVGGLGSVPGALIGGLVLGVVESFAAHYFGPQNAPIVGFILLLFLLLVKPTGLVGIKGYE